MTFSQNRSISGYICFIFVNTLMGSAHTFYIFHPLAFSVCRKLHCLYSVFYWINALCLTSILKRPCNPISLSFYKNICMSSDFFILRLWAFTFHNKVERKAQRFPCLEPQACVVSAFTIPNGTFSRLTNYTGTL